MVKEKEKINDITICTLPTNEATERNLEIEIRVIKRCCCIILKRKLPDCCKCVFQKICCVGNKLCTVISFIFWLGVSAALIYLIFFSWWV